MSERVYLTSTGRRGSAGWAGERGGRTRRAVVAGTLPLAGAGALAACASPGGQAPPAARQPVTLEYWLWFGPESLAGAQPMLEAYKAVAPQVTLGWSGIGGADFLTKIT